MHPLTYGYKNRTDDFRHPFCIVIERRGRDLNGFSRRADTAENITQTVGQAINRYHIGSTPVLDKQCRAIRNNAERAEGVLLWGCGECLHSQTDTKNRTDDFRHPFCIVIERRGRDSNPRSLAAQRFSRPPQSTTLPPLQRTKV